MEDNYINDWNRRVKSLRERILLLDVSKRGDNVECDILSQSNKQYKITINPNSQQYNITCTCPDFCIRHVTCKHIYWLGYKKMGYKVPEEWTRESVEKLVDDHLLGTKIQGRNECCPICLENIDYIAEDTICCESECYNSVHKMCWVRYFSISYSRKCVICRSWGMPEIL